MEPTKPGEPNSGTDSPTMVVGSPKGEPANVREGSTLGRYVVLEIVGAGGMGVVYRAYDPKLRREVALKLLGGGRKSDGLDTEAESRLLREAQAMAKLSHPNVLPVYDVETQDGEVFIAMEYVEGETLRQWLDADTRSVPAIVDAFVAAGRGLVAAHKAGLVHRDFKPSNVLIGKNGRVRVMDFGLARSVSEASPGPKTPAPLPADMLSTPLTQAGFVTGTPAYMAPEQHEGQASDERSDQYSFCVALFEAIHGRRPFSAPDPKDLAKRKADRELDQPAKPPRRWAWVHRIVWRGLAPKPADRWPSMSALVAALEADPWRRRAMLGAAAVGVGAVALAAWYGRFTDAQGEGCADGSERFAAVWNDGPRTEAAAAFEALGKDYAQQSWTRVAKALDDYGTQWSRAHLEACEATARGEQSAELLDRRMACLSRHLARVRGLVRVFTAADAKVVRLSVPAVMGLEAPERCGDPAVLLSDIAPPSEAIAAEVGEIRQRLAEITALELTGRFSEGRDQTSGLDADARRLDYAPLVAEIRGQRGTFAALAGDYEAATTDQIDAYFTAMAVGHHEQASKSALNLVYLNGDVRSKLEPALMWGRHARGQLDQMGPNDIGEARLETNLGAVYHRAGRYDEAIEHLERALAQWRSLYGDEHEQVATVLNNLANVHQEQGRGEQALELHRRVLAMWKTTLGENHPHAASTHNNLANTLFELGRREEAIKHHHRALAMRRAAFGDRSAEVAISLNNIGSAYDKIDDTKALEHYSEALSILREVVGPEHPYVAVLLFNVGGAQEQLGRLDEGMANLRAALVLHEGISGPEHPNVAECLQRIGEVELRRGKRTEAETALERALAIRVSKKVDPVDIAQTQFALAQATTQPGRASELATAARAAYATAGDRTSDELKQVDAWLAAR